MLERRFEIREYFAAACKGNLCAAAILGLFEREHKQIEELNERRERLNSDYAARQLPLEPVLPYWIAITKSEIRYSLLDLYSLNLISAGLDLLIELGFMQRRHDPVDPTNRKYQYLCLTDAINVTVAHCSNLNVALFKNESSYYINTIPIEDSKVDKYIVQNSTMGQMPVLGLYSPQRVNAPLPVAEKKAKDIPLTALEEVVQVASTGLRINHQVTVRALLKAIVQTNDKEHKSPEELWNENPKFQKYVTARLEWAKQNRQERTCKMLVSLIRLYDTPKYGWLDFERLESTGGVSREVIAGTISNEEMAEYYRSLSGQ